MTLGDGRVILDARLEASQIPPELLGPLAGVLNPWEMVTISGDLAAPRPRFAEWRVDALTLRGITLPAEASQKLIERGLPGADGGRIQFALPKGVASLTVRAAGATLYREQVE